MADKNRKPDPFEGSVYSDFVKSDVTDSLGQFLNSIPGKVTNAVTGESSEVKEGVSGRDSEAAPKKIPGQTLPIKGAYTGPTFNDKDLLREAADKQMRAKMDAMRAEFDAPDAPAAEMTPATELRLQQEKLNSEIKERAADQALRDIQQGRDPLRRRLGK